MVGVVPYGTALLGMVMLPRPVLPLCPVRVKLMVVLLADWFVVMVALDICELVMLPLRLKVMFAPSLLVACMVDVGFGVGEGLGIVVGAGVEVDVVVVVCEGVGVAVGLGVGVGVGVGVDEVPKA